MEPLNEKTIRASFINCSKGEASRISLPRGLAELPWEHLDFLGWRDPGAPDRGYLVAERENGYIGLSMRVPVGLRRSLLRTSICSVCLTMHGGSGVSLFAARRAGVAGREGNTVGQYLCTDLACSLYLRGKRQPVIGGRIEESLTLDELVVRARTNLEQFIDQILHGSKS
ncbi:FBP domain-containing protein [Streptomyces sp. NPDC054940]